MIFINYFKSLIHWYEEKFCVKSESQYCSMKFALFIDVFR